MTEEVQQVPVDDDPDITEAWQRLTDEPDIRGVEAARWDDGQWQVTIWAQEFFWSGPLGVELRQRLVTALGAVEGVTSVEEWDRADYESVVLQMAILDRLLSIEEETRPPAR